MNWAVRNGYSHVVVTHKLGTLERPPHYSKLLVPREFPNFDRWIIVDDDLLISSQAPPLEDVPPGFVGLAPDAEQENTTRAGVEWTGNTGFVSVDAPAAELLEEAYRQGDAPDVWGPFDQGALNAVAWSQNRVFKLDPRWNDAIVVRFFHACGKWHRWNSSKAYRSAQMLKMVSGMNRPLLGAIRQAWGVHLIHARKYAWFFDRRLP